MAIERVRQYFAPFALTKRIQEFPTSSATVALAAKALNCEEERIAKTLAFQVDQAVILIVTAGNQRIDNKKFKTHFQKRARMVPFDQVEEVVGHAAGGVCPFGVHAGVKTYLDQSLNSFETVFPACGSANSAIELSIEELVTYSKSLGWVDVCKS
jgi:prolyl-tRNA editing enzyme YbaK/EbsC (Cys-tRNA(Pro) deacylase)